MQNQIRKGKNEIFHKYLYEEKLKHKDHRFNLISMKMIFVASLFGISSIPICGTIGQLFFILLLVPVLCFSTDIYILAEDYKVKRIGKFIRENYIYFSKVEFIWEYSLSCKNNRMREKFSKINSFIVSCLLGLFGLLFYIKFSKLLDSLIISDIRNEEHIGFYIYVIEFIIFAVIIIIIKNLNEKKIEDCNSSEKNDLKTEQ